MKRKLVLLFSGGLALAMVGGSIFSNIRTQAVTHEVASAAQRAVWQRSFEVQVIVDGRPLEGYHARGRNYVEALEGAEYEVRLRNPLPYRVAVALSVDGLNTIDARRTTAWGASKWVIAPYGTITITGWQMSSQRARRFYFTSERDSYGARLGQSSNLGVISAVFFRERGSSTVPITPGRRTRPLHEENSQKDKSSPAPSAGTSGEHSANQRQGTIAPPREDDYAATGIGRSVQNDVRWVNMDLDSRPAAEVLIRYEYYPALVRLGIVPRTRARPDSLRRRENATGFEDRFSPEP